MRSPLANKAPKRFAPGLAAVVILVAFCVGAWIAQAGDSYQPERQAPRSFAQIADEIETSRLAAETCRAIIDKPLRCLP